MTRTELNITNDESLKLDIRAEIFFTYLINVYGLKKDPVTYPRSAFKRKFRKDVSRVVQPGNYDYKLNRTVIETNRDGIYDIFPEYLFHKNKKNKNFKTVEDLKENSAYNRQIEHNTRKLFWPIDDRIFRMKQMISSLEEIEKLGEQGSTTKILSRFWRIPPYFSKSQTELMLSILPIVRDISVNIKWVAKTISIVINEQVEMKEVWEKLSYQSSFQFELGSAELANTSICGKSFTSVTKKVELCVGPIENNKMTSFIAGGVNRKRLNSLLDYLVAADLEVDIQLIAQSKKSFILSPKLDEQNILGITTVLN